MGTLDFEKMLADVRHGAVPLDGVSCSSPFPDPDTLRTVRLPQERPRVKNVIVLKSPIACMWESPSVGVHE